MPTFGANATSKEVVAAFSTQVAGRVFVITGAGHPSIGSSIAVELAAFHPAHIIIASRTAANVDPVINAINEIDPSIKTSFVQMDLSDHGSVQHAATKVLATAGPEIHVVINSAGIMATQEYTVDKQGIELQLSVNHFGHFLFTNLLVPALLTAGKGPAGPARVVNLTSAGYQISPVRFSDYNFSNGDSYDPWSGYGQAKTAQILFSCGLTRRLKDQGVISFACHPGSNLDTKLGSHLVMSDYEKVLPTTLENTGKDFLFLIDDEPRFKSYDQIGATPLIAALDPDIAAQAPAYLQNNMVVQPISEHAYNQEDVERLWKLSEELVGLTFDH